ncbi:MAG: bestrophin family ion channel [Acidobacteria bacterium]|nr:bestrophin family ion channel [Acidobacteriota bacterium]
MIQYDPHRWFDHFFDVRGSLLREISGRVSLCAIWTVGVVAVHFHWFPVAIPPLLHTLVGTALGLLLVFRTNASYDRFWEGRKLWGGIVNETRNLIRGATEQFGTDREGLIELTRWTAVFPFAAASGLRGEGSIGPLAKELSAQDVASVTQAQHVALAVASRMTAVLNRARREGRFSDIIYTGLDQNIQQLVDYLGACERIRKTPLPFAYVVHLRRALVMYCFTLPFALVSSYGWYTILDVLLIAYVFFGIEEIGVEIEGPFGTDDNDLPLEDICETIHRNLYAIAGIEQSPRETMPDES